MPTPAEAEGDDLADVGVTIVGHRRKLLDAVAALRAGGEFPQPPGAEATRPSPSLAATALAAKAERRQLTVMFIDLVGSTALSARLDPEEMERSSGPTRTSSRAR